jgi:pantothenate synthetase
MGIFEDISLLQTALIKMRERGDCVGFVPAKYDIHEGQLSLILQARDECDVVLLVLKKLGDQDKKICQACGVDYILISEHSCQDLIALLQPDFVYFGQKHYRDFFLINKIAQEAQQEWGNHFEVKLCPTVRDEDGVALSRRNGDLSKTARSQAPLLYESLQVAGDMFEWGELATEIIEAKMRDVLSQEPTIRIEEISFFDVETLEPVTFIDRPTLVSLKARVGKVTLTDNVILKFEAVAVK